MFKEKRIIEVDDIQIMLKHDVDACKNCMYGYKNNPKIIPWCKFIRDPRDFSNISSSFNDFCKYSGLIGNFERPEDGSLDNFPHDANVVIPKSPLLIGKDIQDYHYYQETLDDNDMLKDGVSSSEPKQHQPTPRASINDYCEKVCIMTCVKDCPLYIWRQRKNTEDI